MIIYKRMDFGTLARYSPSGSINTLHFRAHNKLDRARWQDDVKTVWRITDKFVFRVINGGTPDVEFGGGKEEGREAEWQRILQAVFEI